MTTTSVPARRASSSSRPYAVAPNRAGDLLRTLLRPVGDRDVLDAATLGRLERLQADAPGADDEQRACSRRSPSAPSASASAIELAVAGFAPIAVSDACAASGRDRRAEEQREPGPDRAGGDSPPRTRRRPGRGSRPRRARASRAPPRRGRDGARRPRPRGRRGGRGAARATRRARSRARRRARRARPRRRRSAARTARRGSTSAARRARAPPGSARRQARARRCARAARRERCDG